MRSLPALLPALLIALAPLLPGCEVPADSYRVQTVEDRSCTNKPAGYDALMADGVRANRAGRGSDAETSFRAAVTLLDASRVGKDDPCRIMPNLSLALQMSIAGNFDRASALMTEAERVLALSRNPVLTAKALHYRGLLSLDQGKLAEADRALRQAEGAYKNLAGTEAVSRVAVPRVVDQRFDPNSDAKLRPLTREELTANNPATQAALQGLIEVERLLAIVSRKMGRPLDAEHFTNVAINIARANNLDSASVDGRTYRTVGVNDMQTGSANAVPALRYAVKRFEQATPRTKPSADAQLLLAAGYLQVGDNANGVKHCTAAVRTLIDIRESTSPDLIEPCLDAYAALGQTAVADMFLAAQVAQGSLTSQQIAQASAALVVKTRDPVLADLLKQRDNLKSAIANASVTMDVSGGAQAGPAAEAASAAASRAGRATSDLAIVEQKLREREPNFAQLAQDVVAPGQILGALGADEAFVSMFLGKTHGWVFVLRTGNVSVARIGAGSDAIGAMVDRVRAGIVKTQRNSLPVFDTVTAQALHDTILGGVSASIQSASSLIVAPSGPMLSLPFGVLLTGAADPGNLAAAPWLVKRSVIAHVPSPSSFVGLRKAANRSAGSSAKQRWFGFGEFRRATAAQAAAAFPSNGPCAATGRRLPTLSPLESAKAELGKASELVLVPHVLDSAANL